MKAAPRLLISLKPSRWQARLSCFLSVLAAATLAYVLIRLGCMPMLAYFFALMFGSALSYQQFKLRQADNTQLIFGDDGVWIQNKVDASPSAELPALKNMRCYLGLIYLRNGAARDVLIWPDSVSAEEHRQLRVWLGIHARF
jgi:hypothetical protein